VSFADGVATGFAPGSPEEFLGRLAGRQGTPFDPRQGLAVGATRLADALGVAEDLLVLPRREPGALCVLAPLTYTDDSPSGVLARLQHSGVALTTRAPPPWERGELALVSLDVPPRVEAGAPLIALAHLAWHPGTTAEARAALDIEIECDGSTRTQRQAFALPPRAARFEVPLDCGPAGFGQSRLRARTSLASGPDGIGENDQATAVALAEGARVLAVAVRPEQRATAQAWLAPAGDSALVGLQFVFVAPEDLAAELPRSDAVLSFDLPASALPGKALELFVQRGGGWFAVAGFGFLSEWLAEELEGSVARLLPCTPAAGDAGERDVVLLVDGSGSMEGEPFESVRAAALELVASALPSDRVSLRFFTVRLEEEHLLKDRAASKAEDRVAARESARTLLGLRVPQGMTFLLRSLEEFRAACGERETLALLLSDGWERDALPDEQALAARLFEAFQAAQTRLVAIAVGEPNRALLGALAGGEERVRMGRNLEELRAIFQRELHGAQLVEGELQVRVTDPESGSLASEILGDSRDTVLPRLERFVKNRLRERAESLWTGAEGDPVLAIARAGLGRTALFGSRPGPGWASRFVHVGLGQPQEFESLLRWLARGPERVAMPRARWEAGELCVSGLPSGLPAVLEGRLLADERELPVRCLPPSGVGVDPLSRRCATLAALPPASAVLDLPQASAWPIPVGRTLSSEFARTESSLSWPASGDLDATPELRADSHPLASWVLGIGLLVLGVGAVLASRDQGVPPFVR
jgi:hypothetical protein